VKETDEAFRVPLLLMTDHHFSMATDIKQHSNLPVLTTNNNHRLLVDDQRLEIPSVRKFTFIGDVVPVALPVLVHCGLRAVPETFRSLYSTRFSVSLLYLQWLLTDVNYRAALQIRLSLPQDFARHRRGIAFTKHNILEQIGKGISLSPVKIDVGHFASLIAQMQ
jgi:hypothetical protein